MIIVMKRYATQDDIQNVIDKIREMGYDYQISYGGENTLIFVIGSEKELGKEKFIFLKNVDNVIQVAKPYKLASREFKSDNTIIDVNGIKIGGEEVLIIAGPCSIESEEQLMLSAEIVKNSGIKFLRGGAFKPRTSPYSFQGLGESGLRLLAKAREKTGLNIVTEVMDTSEVNLVAEYADILQVGARNMQNTKLLQMLGKINKPVLLKRSFSATLNEFLLSAEYILSSGNENVILCERGIRTFVEYTRNTLDLNIVPAIKQISHLPIIVDPSHGTGKSDYVIPMSRAAIAAGADGLLVEIHPNPANASSDGEQSLTPESLIRLMSEVKGIASSVGRKIL
ncbi:MAG: 2-keto-3-deoxy-D-arabino-heptulosonate-7-phosphate synthase I beta [Ignavibacteriae bacterium]|nr:MAG: 2-keto-3-deoxy-D-arabino-heptulosonate-7-phosphate synthase I beta [Ignavibacteriota bacterium]